VLSVFFARVPWNRFRAVALLHVGATDVAFRFDEIAD
jgi:hypothetical protein